MTKISPTPYPDVNELLNLLLPNVKEILRDEFVGMYLYGSLANGGFDRYSDVDVLVVTQDEISKELFSALDAMHIQIARLDSWCATQLEVSYIPRTALRQYDPTNNRHPHLDRGMGETLFIMQHASDWVVQRHTLREHGICLAGPNPKALIDPVSQDDLRHAMLPDLFGWYAHFLDEPDPFTSQGYQSYTVLTLCRILHTLQAGEVVSKKAAAEWAQKALDARWKPLIEHAWLGRQSPGQKAEADKVKETLEFIRYALELGFQTLP